MTEGAVFVGFFLGWLFLVTGLSKLVYLQEFVDAISAYKVLSPNIVRLAAMGIVIIELTIGAALELQIAHPIAGIAASVLLFTFAAAIVHVLRHNRSAPCGCSVLSTRRASGLNVARNLILAGAALFAETNYPAAAAVDFPGTATLMPLRILAAEALMLVVLAEIASTLLAVNGGDQLQDGRGVNSEG